jgi:hypothetical protein
MVLKDLGASWGVDGMLRNGGIEGRYNLILGLCGFIGAYISI